MWLEYLIEFSLYTQPTPPFSMIYKTSLKSFDSEISHPISRKHFVEHLEREGTQQPCLCDPILAPRSARSRTKPASMRMKLGRGERTIWWRSGSTSARTISSRSAEKVWSYRCRSSKMLWRPPLPSRRGYCSFCPRWNLVISVLGDLRLMGFCPLVMSGCVWLLRIWGKWEG